MATESSNSLEPATAEVAMSEEAFGKLLQLVRAVQTGLQNIDPGHGLSGSQLWALWHISAQPGLRVADLAQALHIQPSTASNLLDKIEARGLVRRERLDRDNRIVRLHLAEPGRELVTRIPGPLQGRLRRSLQDVPPEVLRGLIDGIDALLPRMRD